MTTPRDPDPGRLDRANDLAAFFAQLVGLAVSAIILDHLTGHQLRAIVQRVVDDVAAAVSGPDPPEPSPAELSALHDEARRIVREARP